MTPRRRISERLPYRSNIQGTCDTKRQIWREIRPTAMATRVIKQHIFWVENKKDSKYYKGGGWGILSSLTAGWVIIEKSRFWCICIGWESQKSLNKANVGFQHIRQPTLAHICKAQSHTGCVSLNKRRMFKLWIPQWEWENVMLGKGDALLKPEGIL